VLFFHGGGFIAGDIPPYDEPWKLFVEKFAMPVVSVAYRLLPENPYPTPYEDCFCALQWVYSNADTLQIDREKIFVAGDSAGGNLAQYCATRAKNSGMVRGQLLLYPTLNPFRTEDKYYRLGEQNFAYEPKQKTLSRCITRQLEMMIDAYAEVTGIKQADEMCSPYTHSAAGDPPTFLAVGALDFLKIDGVAWAHKLQDSGVSVKVVMYNGMGHGFLNATGVFPQAEDCIDEMGEFIRSVIRAPR
jgi:acetyl esterase/lipase